MVLMSGNLNVIDGLNDWGMPCLEKPFRLAALHAEVVRVMDDSQNQLQQSPRSTFKVAGNYRRSGRHLG